MGLAGPKKRAKLSHDPNNTAWSRNTESFGHKILSSQGWTPGETLGAVGAAHADHYTAGSNSHIRVLLKDNQLGLGAKLTGNNAETFGLSLFSGILGRLNGKSDVEVEKEQRAQKDVELALYQSRKLGFINFVSAGFLVGDRIDKAEIVKREALNAAQKEDLKNAKTDSVMKDVVVVRDSKPVDSDSQGTKRKRAGAETDIKEASSDSASSSSEEEEKAAAPKAKKSKKSKKSKSSDDSDAKRSSKPKKADATEDPDTTTSKRKSKKESKKDKKSKTSSDSSSSETEDRAAKKARRAEKRAQKEERRQKKEAKRAAKSASASATPSTTAPGTLVSGSVTPQPFIGRHAVRQRYIAAKGRAHLDPQALKEIFMVKA